MASRAKNARLRTQSKMIQPLGAGVGRQDSVPLTVTSCCPTRRGNDQDMMTRAEALPRCLLVDVVGTRKSWNLTV
jgi:hypothetical protein